jgi:hypothetical protein
MLIEGDKRIRSESRELARMGRIVRGEKMVHEQGNILRALAERRNVERYHPQTVEQILTEASRSDELR